MVGCEAAKSGLLGCLLLTSACADDSGSATADGTGATATGGINLDDDDTAAGEKFDLGGTGIATGGNAEGDSGCADVQVTVDPEIPTIMLLVDQSGSMTSEFGGGMDRWNSLYTSLIDPATGVVMPLEGEIRFGLTLYTSEDGFDGPQCPMLLEVPPALDNYAAMDTVYEPAVPNDETPTGESVAAVAMTLDAFAEPGPKAIVLATDGLPDTCQEPNPQNGQPVAVAEVQAAFALGIKTFVLSVGDEVGEAQLQEVANAGIGLPPQGPMNAPFWIALDAADLADAFDEIVGGFISCTLEIDGMVTADDFCEGTVVLDGVVLECPVDWTLVDPMTIELLGSACDTLQDGGGHTVSANFPCGAVVIP